MVKKSLPGLELPICNIIYSYKLDFKKSTKNLTKNDLPIILH